MSVYIKDMEMPEPGAYLIRLYVREDGGADIWGVGTYIPKEPLPVVPIPPHGRLIDADALAAKIIKRKCPTLSIGEDGSKDRVRYIMWRSMISTVDEAPTIIPAEPPKGVMRDA